MPSEFREDIRDTRQSLQEALLILGKLVSSTEENSRQIESLSNNLNSRISSMEVHLSKYEKRISHLECTYEVFKNAVETRVEEQEKYSKQHEDFIQKLKEHQNLTKGKMSILFLVGMTFIWFVEKFITYFLKN